MKTPLDVAGARVLTSGVYSLLDTDFGLRVKFDGVHHLEITIPGEYYNKVPAGCLVVSWCCCGYCCYGYCCCGWRCYGYCRFCVVEEMMETVLSAMTERLCLSPFPSLSLSPPSLPPLSPGVWDVW